MEMNNESNSFNKINNQESTNLREDYEINKTAKYSKITTGTSSNFFLGDTPKNIKGSFFTKRIIPKINKSILRKYFSKYSNTNKIQLKKIPKIMVVNNPFTTLHKSKTQSDFFQNNVMYKNSYYNLYNTDKNFNLNSNKRNISTFCSNIQNSSNSYINNNNSNKYKTNSLYSNLNANKSIKSMMNSRNKNNKIIYFNSSLNDFYGERSKFNLNSSSVKKIHNKYSYLTPKSFSQNIDFINDLINTYNISQNNKDKNILIKKIKQNNINNKKKLEEENKKLLKEFNFLPINKSVLKTLFRKIPIKIKKDALTVMSEEKIKSHNLVNPLSNSYGNLLNEISEKIGFMKGSINMIYPKISKVKYDMKAYERKKEYTEYIKDKKNNIKRKYNNSVEDTKNPDGNRIVIYNISKPKKITQTYMTKCPIKVFKNGDEYFTKMYTLRRQRKFVVDE